MERFLSSKPSGAVLGTTQGFWQSKRLGLPVTVFSGERDSGGGGGSHWLWVGKRA